ncbi:hypothetical protein KIW84_021380 [Lathyrus oleraceus]|uniref:Uncharacterized protein n=1 Tax=Pisum sativum TaxID=3888 RepID=A0A9D4YA41_PEA|nr:hypothetical protein KIW84_021380 [Pisum sativum]
MVRAWRKIHRKGRKELGPKNCVAMEPYTTWVRKRASDYLMPYEYPRPTPLVMVGPSTLPDQGVEESRDKDRSRAWIREREELLQQIKEKDALIEFLEHQVIDDSDDAWTSLLPQSSRFWKRKYDRLAKEKADMEAAYEREVKRLHASYLPVQADSLVLHQSQHFKTDGSSGTREPRAERGSGQIKCLDGIILGCPEPVFSDTFNSSPEDSHL